MADPKLKIVVEAKDNATAAFKKVGGGLDAFAGKAKAIGGGLTAGVTLPIVGAAAAAIKLGMDLNKGMANVQSLGIAQDRVLEMKDAVQQMAIATGKATDDLADGAYQVVSAFGDTSDSMKILEVNAKAAAAGLATTTDAINLTSAVTKGYGDTSAAAVQQAADLAFQTVKLGQTTFPELASSMGKVVPMAAALGVKQETLFAQMATLTGVTGGAAEVSTQLRATFQALIKPTGEMAKSITMVSERLDAQGKLAGGPLVDAWRAAGEAVSTQSLALSRTHDAMVALEEAGHRNTDVYKNLKAEYSEGRKTLATLGKEYTKAASALGPVIVKSVGTVDALSMLTETAAGNTDQLGKMFGSVEALGAVLALNGGQADTFKEKLAAMSDVQGASDDAFKAQTEGVNAQGFAMEQLKQKVTVAAQKLGDQLAPALAKIMDRVLPLTDKLVALVQKFSDASPQMQKMVGIGLALVAAIGPIIMIVGTLTSVIATLIPIVVGAAGAIGTVVAVLGGPLTLAILAIVGVIAGLTIAWSTNFLGIRDITASAIEFITGTVGTLLGFIPGISTAIQDVTQSWADKWSTMTRTVRDAVGTMIGFINKIIDAWNGLNFKLPKMLGGGQISLPGIPRLSFAGGGVVPGARGAPVPAIVHGGERILPPGAAGVRDVHIHVSGSVVTEGELIATVKRSLQTQSLAGASLGLT